MLVHEFAARTRARSAEVRVALDKFRGAGKELLRELARIDKRQRAEHTRVLDHLGQLAEDIVDKLPAGATASDMSEAHRLQEQLNDLYSDVDEVPFLGSAVEDLAGELGMLRDTLAGIQARLRETETQISGVERLATRLGI